MLDHGHPEAPAYPIGFLWDEAAIVYERLNTSSVTANLLLKDAVSSIFSKDGLKLFKQNIDKLTVETKAKETGGTEDDYQGPDLLPTG